MKRERRRRERAVSDRICLLLLAAFLGICTFFDVKNKRIPVALLAAGAAAGAGVCLLSGRPFSQSVVGLIPGVILLCISPISRKGVGAGDGVCAVIAGLFAGLYSYSVLLAALFAAAMIGGIWSLAKKKGRKWSLPFAPFLTGAALLLGITA